MQLSFVAVYLTFLLTLGLAGARPVYVVQFPLSLR